MMPLEASLGGAVSLDKGCYIGQEESLVRVGFSVHDSHCC